MRLVLCLVVAAACAAPKPAPSNATVWGPPDDTMVLGLDADGEVVTAFMQNLGSNPQRVIATGIRLTVERPGWRGAVSDHAGPTFLDRDETFVVIAPGDHHVTPIDLGARARTIVGSSGGRAIEPGTYTVTASYNSVTAAAGNWWTGVLEAGPLTIDIR